jgi:hypothetical protein
MGVGCYNQGLRGSRSIYSAIECFLARNSIIATLKFRNNYSVSLFSSKY